MSAAGPTSDVPVRAVFGPDALPAAVQAALVQAAQYAADAVAPAPQRTYCRDWPDWCAWCASAHVAPLPAPPAAIGAYLAARAATLAVGTLERRLAAISTAHRLARHHLDTSHPAMREVWRGIRRRHGVAPRRATAATTPILRDLVAACDA